MISIHFLFSFIPNPRDEISRYKMKMWIKVENGKKWHNQDYCKFAHYEEEKRKRLTDPVPVWVNDIYKSSKASPSKFAHLFNWFVIALLGIAQNKFESIIITFKDLQFCFCDIMIFFRNLNLDF